MKKFFRLFGITVIMYVTTCSLSFAQGTHSGQAVKHSVAASSHAGQSAVHSVAAVGRVVSGVVAIPLMSAGAAGAVSADMGEALWDAANAPAGGPLELTDETITVGPPPDKAVAPRDIQTNL